MRVNGIYFDGDGVSASDYSGSFKTVETQDGIEVWARQKKVGGSYSELEGRDSTLLAIQQTGVLLKCYYDHSSFGKYYFYGTKENNSDLFTMVNVDDFFFPDHAFGDVVDYPILEGGIPGRENATSEQEVLIENFYYANGDTIEYEDYYSITSTPEPRSGKTKFLPEDYAELRVDRLCEGKLYSLGYDISDGSFEQDESGALKLKAHGWHRFRIEHQMSSIQRPKMNMTGMVVIYDNSTNRWSFGFYSGRCFWTPGGSMRQYADSTRYLTASV